MPRAGVERGVLAKRLGRQTCPRKITRTEIVVHQTPCVVHKEVYVPLLVWGALDKPLHGFIARRSFGAGPEKCALLRCISPRAKFVLKDTLITKLKRCTDIGLFLQGEHAVGFGDRVL